jgi:hypothetical protein
MILYNVTINIDMEKEEEFVTWMKRVHIPEVMATGIFEENKFFRLLQEVEEGGANYSAQYSAKNMENIHQYQQYFAKDLQKKLKVKFGDHFVAFRSLLELVE